MKYYEASFTSILMRFYLMMIAVVVPFLIGMPILALLACPIFLSAMLGVSFSRKTAKESKTARYSKPVNRELVTG